MDLFLPLIRLIFLQIQTKNSDTVCSPPPPPSLKNEEYCGVLDICDVNKSRGVINQILQDPLPLGLDRITNDIKIQKAIHTRVQSKY